MSTITFPTIVRPVPGYAQTNLQLYAQLRASGWGDRSLVDLGRAYELAIDVCGAHVRPNGKPFLCHLVGTASIVATWDAPDAEVACALLHSVYTHGSFAAAPPKMTREKQAIVRAAVGDEPEELIAAYTRLPWTRTSIDELGERADGIAGAERSSVRVRLANELEDHLDLGLRYAQKTKPAGSLDRGDARLVLARELVGDAFAQELEAAIAANVEAEVPEGLVRSVASSFRVGVDAPQSG